MNEQFLNEAFFYAEEAFKNDEIPIGAVIVKDNEVISYGFNSKESEMSIFEHAEVIAIRRAQKIIGNWRLNDCDIYVTLDPCPMCASAIKQARIRNVFSALSNSDAKNTEIIELIFKADKINPKVNFVSNLNVMRSKTLLSDFFKKHRIN